MTTKSATYDFEVALLKWPNTVEAAKFKDIALRYLAEHWHNVQEVDYMFLAAGMARVVKDYDVEEVSRVLEQYPETTRELNELFNDIFASIVYMRTDSLGNFALYNIIDMCILAERS